MPRPSKPLTPALSSEIVAKQHTQESPEGMETSFTLPPSAMNPPPSSSNNTSPPVSPNLQRKRTLSGGTKRISAEDLPPPPSRARKIIQMKPKSSTEQFPPISPNINLPQTSTNLNMRPPSSHGVAASSSAGQASSPTHPKGKRQPSTTSAAGRKIARKTAHSIIERRRRSKMNEEFGVLKDMIPACKDVEMHKLAILQAGIEYVRYLQGCVAKLSAERGLPPDEEAMLDDDQTSARHVPDQSPTSFHEAEEAYRRSGSIATGTTTSTYNSPALGPSTSSHSLTSLYQPQRQLPPLNTSQSVAITTYSTSPPPLIAPAPLATGVSPAFNAIHFSPDLSRTATNASAFAATQSYGYGSGNGSGAGPTGKPSPQILPLPQAAMPPGPPHGGEGVPAEVTATAALMMLTNDRRGGGNAGASSGEMGRGGGGMSVRDLLSH